MNRTYKILSDCNRALIYTSKESDLLQKVCHILVKKGGYQLAWIGFIEHDEAQTVQPVAQAGDTSGYLETTRFTWANSVPAYNPLNRVVRTGKPAISKDILTDPDYRSWRDKALKHGFLAHIALPLLTDLEVIGILNVYTAPPETFNKEAIELLIDVASNLSYGIMNIRLQVERKQTEEKLKQRSAQLVLINDIGSKIAAVLKLDKVLKRAAHLVQKTFDYHHVALFLVDKNLLKLKAISGSYETYFPPHHTQRLDEGINGWVATSGQKIVTNDVSQEARYISLIPEYTVTQAELCLPIKVADQTVGVLDIQSPNRNAFSNNDVFVMETLTDQIAVAIENARQNEAIQQELWERKQAEKALQKSEELFRQVISSISDHIYVTKVTQEEAYTNLYISPHVESLTGYPMENFVNDRKFWPEKVIHPEDQGIAKAQSDRLAQGQDSEEEYRLVRKDHSIFWVRDSARVQNEGNNKIIYGVVSDITERKKAEQEVQKLYEELEQRVIDRTRELSALYDVTTVASESLDLETTLEKSLERVLIAMKSKVGTIHLLREEENRLNLAAQQGFAINSAASDLIILTDELTAWIIEHSEPLVIPDLSENPRVPPTACPPEFYTYVGVPMQARGRVLGVLSVLGKQKQQFNVEEVALLSSIADQIGVAVENARLRQRAEQAAIIEERERLARELHDSVTQSIYSLVLLTSSVRRFAEAGSLENVAMYVSDLGEIAQQSLKEMRLLVHQLRPEALEQQGLIGALQQRLDAVEGRANVETRLLLEGDETQIPFFVEEGFYRIAQEALNNALKHAAADWVTIQVSITSDWVELKVEDNGRGFNIDQIEDKGGLGLTSMQERAKKLNGSLTIHSKPEEGTEVKVRVEI